MAPELTDDLNGALQSLLGLYGEGQPQLGKSANLADAIAADVRALTGHGATGYTDARGARTTVVESHAGKDSIVNKAVGASGDGTVHGRNRLTNQIAELQARVQAIASVGDTRFSGPALLNAAQTTIFNATRQVNADVAASQHQASQISPPAAIAQPKRRRGTPYRRRPSRYRSRSASRSRRRGRGRVPSDGTIGGKAVSAADGCVDTPYIWGGGCEGGPTNGGFDCSGLTQYAIAQATNGEVVLPRTTYEQIYSGERVHPQDVRPGDLVFPASSFSERGPEHVQLAAGNGMVIEAPHEGSVVQWSPMPSRAVVIRVL